MQEDFSGLNAAVDKVSGLISEAVAILQNPATDNNNQAVIDAVTLRLSGAADALAAAVPAPAPAPAPVAVAAPEPVAAPVETPVATDTTTTDAAPAAPNTADGSVPTV